MSTFLFLLAFGLFYSQRTPVLLFPGLPGSQITYQSSESSGWGQLWLDITRTITSLNDYIPVVKANYNPDTDLFSTNVYSSKPVGWGSTVGLDHLDDNLPSSTYYFHKLISALGDAGYVDGVDLFGAPFDFRLENYKSVDADNGLFSNLKALIESIYKSTNKPLYIVSHGEAASMLRCFFAHYVDAGWKDSIVAGWISASGAFAGGPTALHYLISYKPWIIPFLNGEQTHEVLSNFAGLFWSLPTVFAFPNNYLLAQVTTDTTAFNITLENITEAFTRSVGDAAATAATNFGARLNAEFDSPDVNLTYFYGTGIDTVAYEVYQGTDATWWQQDGEEHYTDGDGLIPTESAIAPQAWAASSRNPIEGVELWGVSSQDILSNDDFVSDVVGRVTSGAWKVDPARPFFELKQKYTGIFLDHARTLESNFTNLILVNKEKIRSELKAENLAARRVQEEGVRAIAVQLSALAQIHTAAEKDFGTATRVVAAAWAEAEAETKAEAGTGKGTPAAGDKRKEQFKAALEEALRRRTEETVARLDAQYALVTQAVAKVVERMAAL